MFKVGDHVVCVDDSTCYTNGLTVGKKYVCYTNGLTVGKKYVYEKVQ